MLPVVPEPKASPSLWSRLSAVGRSGRRITRAGLFTFEIVQQTRRIPSAPTQTESIRARVSQLAWFAENMCSLHGIRVDVVGAPRSEPAIYVANHLGYVDPMAILSVVPCAPIAKEEIGEWPIVGQALRELGVMMVYRHDPYSGARVLRNTIRTLEQGVSVLAFPEGTTTEGHDVLRLRRGVFGVARRLGVPIVPIVVRHDTREVCWVGDDDFLPHYVRTTSRPMIGTRLVFGDPIDPGVEPDARELARHTRAVLRTMLARERTQHGRAAA